MRRLLLFLIAASFCLVPGRPAHAATPDEAGVVARLNAVRARLGARPLALHPELERKADAWAAKLAADGALSHSALKAGITARWLSLAENLAMAGTVAAAEQEFLDSPVHYRNLVNPATTHIGVGIVSAGGRVYVVEEFMRLAATSPASVPPAAPSRTVTAPAPVAPKPAAAPGQLAPAPPAPAESPGSAPPPTAAPLAQEAAEADSTDRGEMPQPAAVRVSQVSAAGPETPKRPEAQVRACSLVVLAVAISLLVRRVLRRA